jgi:hypothetical protein
MQQILNLADEYGLSEIPVPGKRQFYFRASIKEKEYNHARLLEDQSRLRISANLQMLRLSGRGRYASQLLPHLQRVNNLGVL